MAMPSAVACCFIVCPFLVFVESLGELLIVTLRVFHRMSEFTVIINQSFTRISFSRQISGRDNANIRLEKRKKTVPAWRWWVLTFNRYHSENQGLPTDSDIAA